MSNVGVRLIAASKKTLAGTVLTLGVADSLMAAAPARAAPQSIKAMAQQTIKDPAPFAAFDEIIPHESGGDYTATNPSSGSYGVARALPGSKIGLRGRRLEVQPGRPPRSSGACTT
ncbi:hypothetical protein GCM10010302_32240 [Streptomyces polychromogenes]|uniref:Uncharacterized protein n=1 Tax=Streptomyces polychromogenes TaxID=67342 RepID=A0ABP3F3E4_9ACTN